MNDFTRNLALLLVGLIAITSLAGVVALAVLERDVPDVLIVTLSTALGATAGAITMQPKEKA